ncbi:hypothetical protein LCGC14_2332140 [marine sediment metagenome]|uniref:Uncharacterized protein n=1 Tax=marine sediment metagenome TaxID=412755 RepID=A0A0F9CEJ0_9ZZZZ
MATKRIDELEAGDRISLADSSGVVEVTSIKPATWVRTTSGHSMDVQWVVISGPRKGETGWYIGGKKEEIKIL